MVFREIWTVEFDPNTGQYSVDFGSKFSILQTDLETVMTFFNWRLEKLQCTNENDKTIEEFKNKYRIQSK